MCSDCRLYSQSLHIMTLPKKQNSDLYFFTYPQSAHESRFKSLTASCGYVKKVYRYLWVWFVCCEMSECIKSNLDNRLLDWMLIWYWWVFETYLCQTLGFIHFVGLRYRKTPLILINEVYPMNRDNSMVASFNQGGKFCRKKIWWSSLAAFLCWCWLQCVCLGMIFVL